MHNHKECLRSKAASRDRYIINFTFCQILRRKAPSARSSWYFIINQITITNNHSHESNLLNLKSVNLITGRCSMRQNAIKLSRSSRKFLPWRHRISRATDISHTNGTPVHLKSRNTGIIWDSYGGPSWFDQSAGWRMNAGGSDGQPGTSLQGTKHTLRHFSATPHHATVSLLNFYGEERFVHWQI